jgi:Xaa-Pro aminopeptidase
MDRRKFLQTSALATAAVSTPELACAALQAEDRAGKLPQRSYPPIPGPFRLPPEWYQANTRRFQKRLAESGLHGAVVTSSDNIDYLTGAFATTTEREIWLFVPAQGEPSIFYPGLDRDLWQTWWVKDGEWYFDYDHSGPFNQIVYEPGPKVDLFAWMLQGLIKRGHGERVIGFEKLSDTEQQTVAKLAPRMKADRGSVGKVLLHMRMVKTPEEIALCRVSIELHDRMLEFGRDYILTHGTSATDFEVEHATKEWGTHHLMQYLKLDGKPHTGVGVNVGFACRTGIATAYPHPNQFFYEKIKRGDSLQISIWGRVGGYGGEGYRAMQILPASGKVDPLREKVWDVHTQMTLKQQELMKAGTKCNVVGAGVLKLARDAGLEKFIYHRPAHGEGAEGHQAPYLSLGNNEVLEENMTFSNEPGLYSPEHGFGYNHSNLVRVTAKGGEQMNRTPLTKEWCWIKI